MFNEQAFQAAMSKYIGSVDIPRFDIEAIRSRRPAMRSVRLQNAVRALSIGIVVTSCVAAAYTTIPKSLKASIIARMQGMGVNVPIQFRSGYLVTLEQAQHEADFKMVLPAGLPKNATLESVVKLAPDGYRLAYGTPRGALYFELHKSKPTAYLFPFFVVSSDSGRLTRLAARVWHTGDQDFIIATNALTITQLAAIKAAMGAVDAPTPPPDPRRLRR